MTMQTASQITAARADSLQGWVRRIGRWVANRCGLLVVTPEKVLEWTQYATEYNRVAGDYDLSDARLSGLNDGRCHSLNRCCQDVRELNSPNEEVSHGAGRKEQDGK
jgi:hypothetical protein